MPELDREEFVFPDEQKENQKADAALDLEIEADEGFDIEIEDDTPEEDRGRQPMPKELVDELEKDELEKYDEATKQRLKQMKKVWHDERREKEAALREQQEAVVLANKLLEENKRIKNILSQGEKEYVESMQTAANLQLEMAKKKYKEAYDAGDTDSVIEAQEAMQNANLKLMQIKNFKMPSLQESENNVQIQHKEPAQPAQVDYRFQAWHSKNPWYGQDDEMTAAALGLHNKLQKQGVVLGSEEYYSTLDKTMRKRFSEYFGEPEEDQVKVKVEGTTTKPSTVVAPATRSTASNKVKLKASQVQLAKKLGLTPEQYALEMRKLENR
jgi:hypothetical protein